MRTKEEVIEELEENYDEYEQEVIWAISRTHEISLEEAMMKLQDISYIHLDSYASGNPEEAMGYAVVDEIYGGVEQLDKNTLENNFNYETYGRELLYDYTIDEETNIAISNA